MAGVGVKVIVGVGVLVGVGILVGVGVGVGVGQGQLPGLVGQERSGQPEAKGLTSY